MKRKRMSEKPRRTILIVTTSQDQLLYFSQMRKDCRYTNMTVLWAEESENLEEFIRFAAKERIRGRFDVTWGVFGFEEMKVTSNQVREVMPYAKKKKVQLAWINPGISLWYLLHLQNPRMPISSSIVVESTLKGILPNFSLAPEYLLNEGDSLHLRLFPAKAMAVVNAGNYNTMAQQRGYELPPVQLTKLITEIADVCGVADMSRNQKLIGLKNN